jgi:hypothetical protein
MNDVSIPPAADAAACPNCRATPRPARLTLRWLLNRLREDVAGLDRGLLPTLRDLLLAPRQVVEPFLREGRSRYYGPFKFFLIATAVSLLCMPDAPFLDRMLADAMHKQGLFDEAIAAEGFVRDWNALLYAPLVVLLAIAMRGFFRAHGLNLAEHLVIALYGWSQLLLVSTAMLLAATGLKALGLRGVIFLPLLLLPAAYWFWYLGRALRLRRLADWVRAFALLPGVAALFLISVWVLVGMAAKTKQVLQAVVG